MTSQRTFSISVPGNPGHTKGASLFDAVQFAEELGYDATSVRIKLAQKGRIELEDEAGKITIEQETT